VEQGTRLMFAACAGDEVLGSVQLALAQRPNARHRAEVQKLLVHRRARRQGLATRLMRTAEAAAVAAGRRLLVLDTLEGDPAERLYLGLGYQSAGVIPYYAQVAGGALQPTHLFYRYFGEGA
jgi:acetyltransferase